MNSASWLHGLYIFTAVFGIGVTAVDMLGLFGDEGGESNGGTATDTEIQGVGGEAGPFLSILRYLRTGVYFCLGFGPLGIVAEFLGASRLGSLAWAIAGGIVSAALARLVFRFQQHDVDSSIREDELLLERARVIVPLSHTTMGKVRVQMGQVIVERYALAEETWETFRTDDLVDIVRVTDDCVYVSRAEPSALLDELS
jgi:hypothetical protein